MKQCEYSRLGYKMIAFSYFITFVSIFSFYTYKAVAGFYYIFGWIYLVIGLYLSRQGILGYIKRLINK